MRSHFGGGSLPSKIPCGGEGCYTVRYNVSKVMVTWEPRPAVNRQTGEKITFPQHCWMVIIATMDAQVLFSGGSS